MATALDVFPPRNLPDDAVQWGRHVEDASKGNAKGLVQLSQTVSNNQRSTGGQMAVLAKQVLDLSERQTLTNTLTTPLEIAGNLTGDARNYWSPFEFTITKPRGVVLNTDITAAVSTTVIGGSLIPIVGVEPIEGAVTTLPLLTSVVTTLTQLGAGTALGSFYQRSYFTAPPGRFRVWAGLLLTSSGAGSSAVASHGVSTLTIGQEIPPQDSYDLIPVI